MKEYSFKYEVNYKNAWGKKSPLGRNYEYSDEYRYEADFDLNDIVWEKVFIKRY